MNILSGKCRHANNVLSLTKLWLAFMRCHLIKSRLFFFHSKSFNQKHLMMNFFLPPRLCRPRRVQESDGSFFESFTALSWKRENRRMSSIRAAETRAEAMPVDEKETIKEDEIETVNEREQLYMDVLYTIANSVGCQQPGGQVHEEKTFSHP